MDWVLVIHEVPEMCMAIEGLIDAQLKLQARCAANLEKAGELYSDAMGSCKLIITSLSAPPSAHVSSPVDRVGSDAVEFLRDIHKVARNNAPACIFLVSTMDASHTDKLYGLNKVELLNVRALTSLCDVAGRLMGNPARRSLGCVSPLDIRITLTGDAGFWYMHNDEGMDDSGPIRIARHELDDLLLDSLTVGRIGPEDAQIAAQLSRRLGRRLYHSVVGNGLNSDLGKYLFAATERLSLLDQARLRFELNSKTSALLVETLACPRDEDQDSEADLWMLKLPIYRKFRGPIGRAPLFKDEETRIGPVNCLLIQGETRAFTSTGQIAKDFPALPASEKEIAWLQAYLQKHCARFHLAPPVVLRACDHEPDEFAEKVSACLQSRPWQLIHYSGHSELGPDKNKAYLVLGSGRDDVLDVEDFACHVPHAQFVFLNSCSSANSSFVLRLVERKIPAVAGYAWPIPDRIAATFSKKFYQNLFPEQPDARERFIEYAFMRAKAGLYNDHTSESWWIAPLLFMQTRESRNGIRRVRSAGALT